MGQKDLNEFEYFDENHKFLSPTKKKQFYMILAHLKTRF